MLVAAFSDRSLNMYALMTSSNTTAARALNPEDIVLEIKTYQLNEEHNFKG